jgi:hypothetical protein
MSAVPGTQIGTVMTCSEAGSWCCRARPKKQTPLQKRVEKRTGGGTLAFGDCSNKAGSSFRMEIAPFCHPDDEACKDLPIEKGGCCRVGSVRFSSKR